MTSSIEEFQAANGMVNEPTILIMDNCSANTSLDVISLFARQRVKVITFSPHTSGIFLVFFGIFKHIKKHLSMDSSGDGGSRNADVQGVPGCWSQFDCLSLVQVCRIYLHEAPRWRLLSGF
jgi:hypothetical protein